MRASTVGTEFVAEEFETSVKDTTVDQLARELEQPCGRYGLRSVTTDSKRSFVVHREGKCSRSVIRSSEAIPSRSHSK